MHCGLFNILLSFYPVKDRIKFKLISQIYCLFCAVTLECNGLIVMP